MRKIKTFLIDLGNSNLEYYELTDEYQLINQRIIPTQDIDYLILEKLFCNSVCVISSVVPKLNSLFKQISNAKTYFIDSSSASLLDINIKNPLELGSDRLITAYAAFKTYQCPCLIIDSGTALTFCFVDNYGVYQGGVILPGLKISSKALNDYTAQVPLIYVSHTESITGKSTKEAVEIGLFQGFKFIINGFISQYRQKYPNLKVVVTGSAITELKDYLDIDVYEPRLIFLGLKDIYMSM